MTEEQIPVRQDPLRLSIPAARALDEIRAGRVMLEYAHDERASTGRRYTALPTGKRIPDEDFAELLRKGRLHPLHDGLFEDCSQTWVAA